MYVVQYADSHRPGYHPQGPTIYEVVKITGGNVWGVHVESRHLRTVNGLLKDGSARPWALTAHDTLAEAQAAAEAVLANRAAAAA